MLALFARDTHANGKEDKEETTVHLRALALYLFLFIILIIISPNSLALTLASWISPLDDLHGSCKWWRWKQWYYSKPYLALALPAGRSHGTFKHYLRINSVSKAPIPKTFTYTFWTRMVHLWIFIHGCIDLLVIWFARFNPFLSNYKCKIQMVAIFKTLVIIQTNYISWYKMRACR